MAAGMRRYFNVLGNSDFMSGARNVNTPGKIELWRSRSECPL
jgi:hypothetical protein